MKPIAIGAAVLCLSLAAVPAVAQNVQGPGGANYGAGSNPQNGGAPNTQSNAPTTTAARHGTHHSYKNASANAQSR